MKERAREMRRRRARRKKAKKERIRGLIAKTQSGISPKKKPAEAPREVKEEKKVIQRRAAAKVIKPEQEAE